MLFLKSLPVLYLVSGLYAFPISAKEGIFKLYACPVSAKEAVLELSARLGLDKEAIF